MDERKKDSELVGGGGEEGEEGAAKKSWKVGDAAWALPQLQVCPTRSPSYPALPLFPYTKYVFWGYLSSHSVHKQCRFYSACKSSQLAECC
jgi:hypothetical protein